MPYRTPDFARRTNRIATVARSYGVKEKTEFVLGPNRRFSEQSIKKNMVKMVRVFRKAALIPIAVGGEGNQSLGSSIDVK